jgi:hypothetical protein
MSDRHRNYFQELHCSRDNEHALEARFEKHPVIQRLSRKILAAKTQMTQIVGPDIQHWLRLEEMLNERETILEKLYFNAGFEHGHSAGKAVALRSFSSDNNQKYQSLADHLRSMILKGDHPRDAAMAALIETAWVFATR